MKRLVVVYKTREDCLTCSSHYPQMASQNPEGQAVVELNTVSVQSTPFGSQGLLENEYVSSTRNSLLYLSSDCQSSEASNECDRSIVAQDATNCPACYCSLEVRAPARRPTETAQPKPPRQQRSGSNLPAFCLKCWQGFKGLLCCS